MKGTIDDVRSNGFHIEAGPGIGYIWVYTNSATHKSYDGLTPKRGEYAVATGTGSISTSLTATYAALYKSAVDQTSVTGQLTSVQPYGYAFRLTNGTYIALAVSRSTKISGTPELWHEITIPAIGSDSTGFAALALSGSGTQTASAASAPASTASSPSTPAPSVSAGVPKHVLTAEYLQGLYGTFSVSPSQAAPYLSWAQTTIKYANGIHNAGIKTQIYVDPNWLATTDPLYAGSTESDFAHTCSGSRVDIKFGSASTRYDTNPNSAANRAHFAAWVAAQKAQGHIDMIFEDNGGPLSPYASYPTGKPCGYSSSSWVNGDAGMNDTVSAPVMVNGLNEFTTSTAPNLQIVLHGSNTAGGDLEGCYNDLNKPVETGSSWNIMEDEEIDVVRAGKLFECMGRDQGSASSNYTGRIFTLASFLLTYDPNHAMLAEEWATPSKFRVMPETGLVPMDPLVSEPSSIESLRQSSGAYGREYAHCYYRGVDQGECAVAVTHDYGRPERFPFSGFTHTLVLSGSGVMDGGSVSTKGPPPPSTMQPYTAVVAFK